LLGAAETLGSVGVSGIEIKSGVEAYTAKKAGLQTGREKL